MIFAFLVAWLWLGEGLNLVQIIGAAIVLVGIILTQTARANKVIDAGPCIPGLAATARGAIRHWRAS